MRKMLDYVLYSHLSNNRGGWNKRGGGAKVAKSINVEVGINGKRDFTFIREMRVWACCFSV